MYRSSPGGTLALKYTPHMFATQVTTHSVADHECATRHQRKKMSLKWRRRPQTRPALGRLEMLVVKR